MQWCNLRTFLLTWMKWHCQVLQRFQEQTNALKRANPPLILSKDSALISQTKRILMSVVEYFENKAKKSKSRPNIIDKITKATSKTGCVMKTIHEHGLFDSWIDLWHMPEITESVHDCIRLQPLICLAINFKA